MYVNENLSTEIERIQKGGDAAQKDNFLELHHDKPMKLVEKVLVPVKEFPKVCASIKYKTK